MTETLCVPAMLGNKAIEVKVQSTVKSIVRHYPFFTRGNDRIHFKNIIFYFEKNILLHASSGITKITI